MGAPQAPDYDNVRWGGPKGLRLPQELFPATILVKKEVDLGSVTGTVTLTSAQYGASLITLTPTAAVTLVWPAVSPGLPVVINNLGDYDITAEVSGNANTVVIPGNSTVQIVHDGNSGGLIANTGTSMVLYTGTTDAVLFPAAVNVAMFTSTGPDAATLAVPAIADNGKILILVNNNTTQTTVTTTTNKMLNGTASTYDTLTAPAHAGAVAFLVASNGFWNVGVLGTGTWVLSEV